MSNRDIDVCDYNFSNILDNGNMDHGIGELMSYYTEHRHGAWDRLEEI